MRTVSDPAARKGVTSPSGTSSTGAEDQPSLPDIGARVGQDNEALRNLLIDTDRRIISIDDAKNAFRRLSEPISTALRDLAQEKIDNTGLRRELAELHTSHDALRDEFGALEQRAAALESDRDSLRRELARAARCARARERKGRTHQRNRGGAGATRADGRQPGRRRGRTRYALRSPR